MPNNAKHSSTLNDAMARVIADLKAMSPEQLKNKLAQHQGGMFSQIADDMEGFSNYLAQNANEPCVQALRDAIKQDIPNQAN